MKTIPISNTRAILLLLLVVYFQSSLAEEADTSWNQVFSFQLNLAQHGNSKAQYILGEMYEKGRGVNRDLDTAILWYRKAEKSGNKKAAARIVAVREIMRREAQEKSRKADEKQRAAKEKARQLSIQKQHTAEIQARQRELQKQQAEAQTAKQATPDTSAKTAAVATNKPPVNTPPETVDKVISPEERARKVKEAEDRAQEIARRNALRQQQQAEAALKKYRAAMLQASKRQDALKSATRYQDPFE